MNKKIFIEQLAKLVSFKTVSGDFEENSKALDYVQSLVDKKAVMKRVKNKNTEILIAGNKNLMTPKIGYLVHMDVVSAKDSQFSLKIKGDKAVGRGSSDMKFSIPLGIELLNTLISQESDLSFSLAITTDEEVGGFDGGAFLAETLKFRPKVLIVPDGGDNLNFVEKAKGVCQILVESRGTAAHASRPWMGRNALTPITRLSARLLDLYGKISQKETWETTMNIGQIQGGLSTNQVCSQAVMKLDFRYPEKDSIKNIVEVVKREAEGIDKTLKISTLSTGLPTFTDRDNPFVKKFLSAMEASYGQKIKVNKTYGASDARHFAKFNIPILMMKPMGGEIHSENEWVSISSTEKFLAGLSGFIERIDPS